MVDTQMQILHSAYPMNEESFMGPKIRSVQSMPRLPHCNILYETVAELEIQG